MTLNEITNILISWIIVRFYIPNNSGNYESNNQIDHFIKKCIIFLKVYGEQGKYNYIYILIYFLGRYNIRGKNGVGRVKLDLRNRRFQTWV